MRTTDTERHAPDGADERLGDAVQSRHWTWNGVRRIDRLIAGLETWVLKRGVRAQLIATLCLITIPAIILALLLTESHSRSSQAFRLRAAEQSSVLVATKIDARLRTAYLLGLVAAQRVAAQPAAPGLADCTGLGALPEPFDGPWALTLVKDGRLLCRTGTPGFEPAAAEPAAGAAAPSGFAVVPADGTPPRIRLAWLLPAAHIQAVLTLPQAVLGAELDPSLLDSAESAAVLDGSGRILAFMQQGTSDQPPPGPLPLALAPGAPFQTAADRTDADYRFVTAIGGTGLRLVVNYERRAFYAIQHREFLFATLESVAVLIAAILAVLWAVDRTIGRWITYFRRVAIAHSRGRLSVRVARLDDAPLELADLGTAINRMANNMADHAALLEAAGAEKAALWQELQHRVKNNFQVIASLLSLYKKSVPGERQDDIRFIEDHVQSMAIAYRISYTPQNHGRTPPAQLVKEVVTALRETARVEPQTVQMEQIGEGTPLDLDKAISLGLYLAYFLPPHLDRLQSGKPLLRITVGAEPGLLTIAFRGLSSEPLAYPPLRQRLMEAYIRQLRARLDPDPDVATDLVLHIPIG
jgi:hypothetical protein